MRSPLDRFLFLSLLPIVFGAVGAMLVASAWLFLAGLVYWMLVPLGWRAVVFVWLVMAGVSAAGVWSTRAILFHKPGPPPLALDAHSRDPIARAFCKGDQDEVHALMVEKRRASRWDMGAIITHCLRAPHPSDPTRQLEFPERLSAALHLLEMHDFHLGQAIEIECTQDKADLLDHVYAMDVQPLHRYVGRAKRFDCGFRARDGRPLWWQVVTRPDRAFGPLPADLDMLQRLGIPWTDRDADGETLLDDASDELIARLPSTTLLVLVERTAPSSMTLERVAREAQHRRSAAAHSQDGTDELAARVGAPSRR